MVILIFVSTIPDILCIFRLKILGTCDQRIIIETVVKENKETQRNRLLGHSFWKYSVLLSDLEAAVTIVSTFQDIDQNFKYKVYYSRPSD